MVKLQISIRVSDTGKALLDALVDRLGVTQAGVIEMGLRELARKEGVSIPEKASKENGKES